MKEQNDFYALHNKYYVVWRFDREDKKATGLLFFIPVAGPALGAGTVLFGFITGEYASIEDIRKAGNVVVSQGIYLLPEPVLSGKLSGSSGTKDTCTVLVN
ncbi:TPA: hypothetical protein HA265_07170 [Candidatus Woesearchaeota archaeon]|nr:hypothetical protein [Candidatus Woesearchaeota archaeon]